jgi:hypothetical protein
MKEILENVSYTMWRDKTVGHGIVTQKYRRVMQHVDLDVMITHFNNVVLNF